MKTRHYTLPYLYESCWLFFSHNWLALDPLLILNTLVLQRAYVLSGLSFKYLMRFWRLCATSAGLKLRLHNDFQGAQDLFIAVPFSQHKNTPSFECTKNQLCFCRVNTYFFSFFLIFICPGNHHSIINNVVASTTFQYCRPSYLSVEQGRSVKSLFVQRIFWRNGHLTFVLISDRCNVHELLQ